uniref:Uncharacterized protein n=1 Tax=Tetranychus urticae TaxID=32264 RepID=A0A158P4E0_TETUR
MRKDCINCLQLQMLKLTINMKEIKNRIEMEIKLKANQITGYTE